MNKAVFLDRDGVLNELVNRDGGRYSPRLISDFQLFPYVPRAVQLIREAGYLAIVVTNQPDISRGFLKPEVLDEMHQILRSHCQVDAIYVCPHDDFDACCCRKPQPGMLLSAATKFNIDFSKSWMIGDRQSDIDAAIAANVAPVFIASGQDSENHVGSVSSSLSSFSTLIDAVQEITQAE